MSTLSKNLTSTIIISIIIASAIYISIVTSASSFLPYAESLADAKIITMQSNEAGYRLADNALRQEVAGMMMSLNKTTYATNFSCTNKFTDISSTKPNSWICKVVETALAKGLIAGNSTFRPEAKITRAEALAMILKGQGIEIATATSSSFNDVKEGWQVNVTETALSQKIISSNTSFNPNALITRGELFVMATNASGLKKNNDSIVTNNTGTITSDNKLFGIGDQISDSSYSTLKDIGVKTVRLSGIQAITWDRVQSGGYGTWDTLFKSIHDNGLGISVPVLAGDPVADNKLTEYSSFMSTIATRYKDYVTYWEIDNEPDLYEGSHEKTPWSGMISETPHYAQVLKTAYKAIKSANPNAKVAIAGMSGSNKIDYFAYYSSILDELNKIKDKSTDQYFDVFNFHYYRQANDYGVDELKKVDDMLAKYGYSDVEKIITETQTYVGTSQFGFGGTQPNQTEKQQASNLVRRYVYWGSNGVSTIYWYTTGDGGKLIKDNTKRLSYYSFKKLADILTDVDVLKAEKVQDSGGISVYKYNKNGKNIWIAWNDNRTSKDIYIFGITDSSVEVMDTVPDYNLGSSVPSYANGFTVKSKSVSGGKITVTLGDVPVIVGDSASLRGFFDESTSAGATDSTQSTQ